MPRRLELCGAEQHGVCECRHGEGDSGAVGKRCAVWDMGAWGARELMPGLRGDIGTAMG